jgi:hypothetical protein
VHVPHSCVIESHSHYPDIVRTIAKLHIPDVGQANKKNFVEIYSQLRIRPVEIEHHPHIIENHSQ